MLSASDVQAIRASIETGYIRGMHEQTQLQEALKGFHEDFRMSVLDGDDLIQVNLVSWIRRIGEMRLENPDLWSSPTTFSLEHVDGNGVAACAKVRVCKGDIFFSIDFFLLYKFANGWRIVAKIFTVQE